MTTKLEQAALAVPNGYALVSIDALKAWGKYDEVCNACQFPVEQAEQEYYDGFKCGAETMRLVLGNPISPEPMYINKDCAERGCACHYSVEVDGEPVAVYAAPVRTKDLTDDEIEEIGKSYFDEWSFGFARAVIAADREKNK